MIEPSPNDATFASVTFEAVYDRLKAMASRILAKNVRHTLNTTALVHEVWLKFASVQNLSFEHSAQFFAYAARAMRHILIDRARARLRHKSGGDWMRVEMDTRDAAQASSIDCAEQVVALDTALTHLEQADARAARVVELRYFAGLSADQIAQVLRVTRRTVDRDWRYAQAFLNAAFE